MNAHARVAALILSLLIPLSSARAVDLPDKNADMQMGVPLFPATAENPMVFEIARKSMTDATKRVKVKVTVDDLEAFTEMPPMQFVPPPRNMGETKLKHQQRIAMAFKMYVEGLPAAFKTAYAASSKDKAEKIAKAINDAAGMGTATAGTKMANGFTVGTVEVKNMLGLTFVKNAKGKINTTGEFGDGVKFKQGGGMSPGSKMTMGAPDANPNSILASGMDPLGAPSLVEAGITGQFVASWFPEQGEPLSEVLLGLHDLLEEGSIPATYHASLGLLSFDGEVPDGSEFYFTTTDSGFHGGGGVAFNYGLVPEPASVLLLGLGATWLAGLRRRRA